MGQTLAQQRGTIGTSSTIRPAVPAIRVTTGGLSEPEQRDRDHNE